MKLHSSALASALTAIALLSSAHAAPILIDAFEGQQDIGAAPLEGYFESQSELAGPNILQGFRDAAVTSTSSSLLSGRFRTTSDRGEWSSRAGAVSTLTLTWDGNDDPLTLDTNGLGGIDVTDGGTNSFFALDMLSKDLVGGTIELSVFDMSGNSASSVTGPLGTVNSLTTLNFDFADFAGVDLGAIGAIQLFFDGVDSLDFTFDNFRIDGPDNPVPLPSAAILMAGGLVLMRSRLRCRA